MYMHIPSINIEPKVEMALALVEFFPNLRTVEDIKMFPLGTVLYV